MKKFKKSASILLSALGVNFWLRMRSYLEFMSLKKKKCEFMMASLCMLGGLQVN